MARGQGFEPQFTASKAAVLPLDEPRMRKAKKQYYELWRVSIYAEGNPFKKNDIYAIV
jgi:hypothetical protein